MLNFNKDDLVETMCEENPELSQRKATVQVNEVLLAVIKTLEKGKDETPNKDGIRAKLTLVGFGSFLLSAKKEREHRNPQTGEKVIKEAHNKTTFKEGKSLSEFTN